MIKTLQSWMAGWMDRRIKETPVHLLRGKQGEQAARAFLMKERMKYLTANYRWRKGEIDLVMRLEDCVVFVEVKTRSSEDWTRPAAAVNAKKKRLLSKTALHYVKQLPNPRLKIRFDIVEVLLSGDQVREIRHLPNAFPLSRPYSYG